MLGVKDAATGEYIAVLTNFATHCWLYACDLISADVSGACSAFVEAQLKEEGHPAVVAMFCPGTHSNIVTVQNQHYPPQEASAPTVRLAAGGAPPHVGEWPDTVPKREAWFATEVGRFGGILGKATLEALRTSVNAQHGDGGSTAAESSSSSSAATTNGDSGGVNSGGAATITASCTTIAAPVYESYLADILATRKGTAGEGTLPPTELTMPTEVQVLGVGAAVRFVGLPSEVYVEYGLEIKAKSKFKHTFVFSYCNDYFADIVTQEAVDEGTCPELDWAKVGPGVRGKIMEALAPQLF